MKLSDIALFFALAIAGFSLTYWLTRANPPASSGSAVMVSPVQIQKAKYYIDGTPYVLGEPVSVGEHTFSMQAGDAEYDYPIYVKSEGDVVRVEYSGALLNSRSY